MPTCEIHFILYLFSALNKYRFGMSDSRWYMKSFTSKSCCTTFERDYVWVYRMVSAMTVNLWLHTLMSVREPCPCHNIRQIYWQWKLLTLVLTENTETYSKSVCRRATGHVPWMPQIKRFSAILSQLPAGSLCHGDKRHLSKLSNRVCAQKGKWRMQGTT